MDLFLKILGVILVVVGAVVVFGAKKIVEVKGLAAKQTINIEADEKEIESLKIQKAIVKVKALGGIIFLPGVILILMLFR